MGILEDSHFLQINDVYTVVPNARGVPQTGSQNVEETANEILDTGKKTRFGFDALAKDNLAERTDAMADVIGRSDKAFREELFARIIERDPNAINTWLSPEKINDLADEGKISRVEHAALAETYAGVYNNGGFATFQASASTSLGAIYEPITQSVIDTPVTSVVERVGYPDQRFDDASRIREFVDFIDTGNGPETAEFRANYSAHLTDTYVLNNAVDDRRRDAAAALATELMTGDTTRPEIAVEVLAGLDASQRAEFIDHVADGTAMFNRDNLEAALRDNYRYSANDLAMPDGVAAIFDTVARAGALRPSADATALAIDFARNADNHVTSGMNRDLDARSDAFGRMVNNHSDAILDDLTLYDRTNVSTVGNDNENQYEVNVKDLAEVLELTVFSGESRYQTAIQNKVLSYARQETDALNNAGTKPQDVEEPTGRLSVLSAASGKAVSNSYADIAAHQESQKALLGFVVDLAFAAVPLGDVASKGVKGVLAEALPAGRIRTAVEGLSKEFIDEGTTRLSDAAKEQLYQSLGPDEANAVIQRELQNTLEAAFVAGIEDGDRLAAVITRADSLDHDTSN